MANPDEHLLNMEDVAKCGGELSVSRIVQVLQARYDQNLIYTLAGPVLISINPFQQIPTLYSDDQLQKYANSDKLEPHIFSLARQCLKSLYTTKKPQLCVVSGESGSGKTEAAKYILEFLSSYMKKSGSPQAREERPLHELLVRCNPALEAFGNSSTQHNDNSSRFLKWMQVYVSPTKDCIRQVKLQHHLLEHRRSLGSSLVAGSLAPPQSNFHIFHDIVLKAVNDAVFAQDVGLGSSSALCPEGFALIGGLAGQTKGSVTRLEGTIESIRSLGIPEEECTDLLRVVVGLMWLGQVEFESPNTNLDSSKIANPAVAEVACAKLGYAIESLEAFLCHKSLSIGDEIIFKTNNPDEAATRRGTLLMGIYQRLFEWLVESVNRAFGLDGNDDAAVAEECIPVNVLDVFGFEDLLEDGASALQNSLEQLLINHCNETLFHFFHQAVVDHQVELYRQEGLGEEAVGQWANKDLSADDACLRLVGGRVTKDQVDGILVRIEDEVRIPGGSDKGFLRKLQKAFGEQAHPCFPSPPVASAHSTFVVSHYAKEVAYSVEGILDKSKNKFNDEMREFCEASFCPFFNDFLFPELDYWSDEEDEQDGTESNLSSPRNSRANSTTVGMQFNQELAGLLATMNTCVPWFVACVKPNDLKAPQQLEVEKVRAQLSYTGIMDVCHVREKSFAVQMKHDEFVSAYKHLCDTVPTPTSLNEVMRSLEVSFHQHSFQWVVGKTLVFLTDSDYSIIQASEETQQLQLESVIRIQSIYRRSRARRELRTMQQQLQKESVIRIQSIYRMSRARRELRTMQQQLQLESVIRIQSICRMSRARRGFRTKQQQLQNKSAIRIQSIYRMSRARRELRTKQQQLKKESAVRIQSIYRMKKAQSLFIESAAQRDTMFWAQHKANAKLGEVVSIESLNALLSFKTALFDCGEQAKHFPGFRRVYTLAVAELKQHIEAVSKVAESWNSRKSAVHLLVLREYGRVAPQLDLKHYDKLESLESDISQMEGNLERVNSEAQPSVQELRLCLQEAKAIPMSEDTSLAMRACAQKLLELEQLKIEMENRGDQNSSPMTKDVGLVQELVASTKHPDNSESGDGAENGRIHSTDVPAQVYQAETDELDEDQIDIPVVSHVVMEEIQDSDTTCSFEDEVVGSLVVGEIHEEDEEIVLGAMVMKEYHAGSENEGDEYLECTVEVLDTTVDASQSLSHGSALGPDQRDSRENQTGVSVNPDRNEIPLDNVIGNYQIPNRRESEATLEDDSDSDTDSSLVSLSKETITSHRENLLSGPQPVGFDLRKYPNAERTGLETDNSDLQWNGNSQSRSRVSNEDGTNQESQLYRHRKENVETFEDDTSTKAADPEVNKSSDHENTNSTKPVVELSTNRQLHATKLTQHPIVVYDSDDSNKRSSVDEPEALSPNVQATRAQKSRESTNVNTARALKSKAAEQGTQPTPKMVTKHTSKNGPQNDLDAALLAKPKKQSWFKFGWRKTHNATKTSEKQQRQVEKQLRKSIDRRDISGLKIAIQKAEEQRLDCPSLEAAQEAVVDIERSHALQLLREAILTRNADELRDVVAFAKKHQCDDSLEFEYARLVLGTETGESEV